MRVADRLNILWPKNGGWVPGSVVSGSGHYEEIAWFKYSWVELRIAVDNTGPKPIYRGLVLVRDEVAGNFGCGSDLEEVLLALRLGAMELFDGWARGCE